MRSARLSQRSRAISDTSTRFSAEARATRLASVSGAWVMSASVSHR